MDIEIIKEKLTEIMKYFFDAGLDKYSMYVNKSKEIIHDQQQEIERLKGECHKLEHNRRYLSNNFLNNLDEGLNPILYTQVVSDCKEWKEYKPLPKAPEVG